MNARDSALRKLAQTIEDLSQQSAAREARERARRRSRVIGALSIGLALGVAGTLGLVLTAPGFDLREPGEVRRSVAGEIGLRDLAGGNDVVVTAAGESPKITAVDDATTDDPAASEAANESVEISGLRARFAAELGAKAAEPLVLAQGSPEVASARSVEAISRGGVYGQPQGSVSEAASSDQADAWQRNALNFAAVPGKAMIAIIFDDVGVDQARSRRATALPGPMTMAILPYGRRLDEHAAAAQASGHELLVHLPMEPYDADTDAGPDPLLTGLPEAELQARLRRALDSFSGYLGVSNHMGSRFTEDAQAMATVMAELRGRGLVFVDSITSPTSVAYGSAKARGVPTARRDVFLDHDPSREAVDAALKQLEQIALEQGYAVGIAHPRDASLDAVADWVPQAKAKGFALVPISVVVKLELAGEAG